MATVKPLLDAGGWVFAVLVMAGVLVSIYKGGMVPGYVHKREIERADKATEVAAEATKALLGTTDALNKMAANQQSLSSLLEGFIAGSAKGRQDGSTR